MGYLSVLDFVEHAESVDRALEWHLQSNCYPPIPVSLVPACKKAIEACADGDTEALIALPDGITWRGEVAAPASAIVEGHRLEAFVDAVEGE